MSRNEVKPAVSAADFVEHAERYQGLLIYSHLRELFSRLNVTCVWDVGANVGQFANMVRSFTGYDGWMLSFEPVMQAHEKLSQRAERDERWRVFKIALGSRNEERAIKVAENAVLSSFLDSSEYSVETFGPMTGVAKEEVVPVRTVDSIAAEAMDGISDARVYLKLDTQGWDLEVLRGAEDSLSAVVGLQTELAFKHIYEGAPHYTETLAYLESKGFELSGVFPVVRDQKLRLIEVDCVLVRPEQVSDPRRT